MKETPKTSKYIAYLKEKKRVFALYLRVKTTRATIGFVDFIRARPF